MAMSAPAPPPLPDWSELHRDPLELIIRSLELQDALSAAAVCTGWRAAAAAALGRALTPRRVLWLLLYDVRSRKRSSGGTIGALLHDVLSGRSYRTTIPRSPIVGSSHGWFLFYGERDDEGLRLFNPFTGTEISVPRPSDHTFNYYNKASLFRSGGRRFLMIAASPKLELFSSGDHEWRPSKGKVWFNDIISHNGRLLSVDVGGRIFMWDIPSKPKQDYCPEARLIFVAPDMDTGPNRCIVKYYLLVAPWGDLLLVLMTDESQFIRSLPTKFTVFRVNLLNQTLEKMTSLQGHTMIWGRQHRSIVSSKLHPALLPDCIFFFNPDIRVHVNHRFVLDNWGSVLFTGVYDLKRHTFLPLPPMLEPPDLSNKASLWIVAP